MSLEAVLKDTPTQAPIVVGDAGPGQLNIAIIGAGLVGLATAAMMRKAGHRITVSPPCFLVIALINW
jgi:threonine dehydrogenase-like Zn-dependent dehydrogenase